MQTVETDGDDFTVVGNPSLPKRRNPPYLSNDAKQLLFADWTLQSRLCARPCTGLLESSIKGWDSRACFFQTPDTKAMIGNGVHPLPSSCPLSTFSIYW